MSSLPLPYPLQYFCLHNISPPLTFILTYCSPRPPPHILILLPHPKISCLSNTHPPIIISPLNPLPFPVPVVHPNYPLSIPCSTNIHPPPTLLPTVSTPPLTPCPSLYTSSLPHYTCPIIDHFTLCSSVSFTI